MPEIKIKVAASLLELYENAAFHFQETVLRALRDQERALVVLSGGNTPAGLFQLLIHGQYRHQIPWQALHFFWADERCVPSDHAESNYGLARRYLLEHVPVPAGHIHPLNGSFTPQAAAAQYQQELEKYAAPGQLIPRFDWVLLGMGSDGHTASLFPGQALAAGPQDMVRAVQADYDDRPAERVTLTEVVLNQAAEIVFLVSGKAKAGALRRVLQGAFDPLQLPAQRIHPADGNVTWLLDQEAAAELE
jgi:6-phosphogluconolactonase